MRPVGSMSTGTDLTRHVEIQNRFWACGRWAWGGQWNSLLHVLHVLPFTMCFSEDPRRNFFNRLTRNSCVSPESQIVCFKADGECKSCNRCVAYPRQTSRGYQQMHYPPVTILVSRHLFLTFSLNLCEPCLVFKPVTNWMHNWLASLFKISIW